MDDEKVEYSYECLYYAYTVSDDDTSTRKNLTHPMTRPTGKTYIGGYLSKEILVLHYFANSTHRDRYAAGAFFELVKSVKSMKKLDALRLKYYYSYYI